MNYLLLVIECSDPDRYQNIDTCLMFVPLNYDRQAAKENSGIPSPKITEYFLQKRNNFDPLSQLGSYRPFNG